MKPGPERSPVFFLPLIMHNKELVVSWVITLIGMGFADVNLILSSIAYSFTITFTGIQIYKHIKNDKK